MMCYIWISEGPLVIVPASSVTVALKRFSSKKPGMNVVLAAVSLKMSFHPSSHETLLSRPDAVPARGSGKQQLGRRRHIRLGGAGVLPQCSGFGAGQPEPAERRRQALRPLHPRPGT